MSHEVKKKINPTPTKKIFAGRIRNKIFLRFVRSRLRARLMREYDGKTVDEMMESVTDDMIMDAVEQKGIRVPGEGGGFLQWLMDNLPAILEIVATLLILFADKPPSGT